MDLEEKKQIGSLFDRIAAHYDGLNHLLSLGIDRCWRRQAVRMMQPVDHVLDVAVGTADLAILMCRKRKAKRVTGIDLSAEMMRIGEQKARRAKADIVFEQVNAQSMPHDDCSFDGVTCAYGVRNFADLDAGLNEMYRVLKPGKELLILDFGYPDYGLFRVGYNLYFDYWLPLIGRLFSHDRTAYTYLNKSVKGFIYGEEFLDRLRKAGFKNVSYRKQSFGISYLYYAKK